MKAEKDPQPTTDEPLDIMRKVYQDAEFHFEEHERTLTLRLALILWTGFATVTAPPWTAKLAAIASGLPRRLFRSRPGIAVKC